MTRQKRNDFKWWTTYQKHVQSVVLPHNEVNVKDVFYWRNKIFCNILTYIAPLSIIALIPSIYMAFLNGIPVVGFTDILAFLLIVIIAIKRGLTLHQRKFIFILVIYCLSIILLYFLSLPGPGLLFLLTITIFFIAY